MSDTTDPTLAGLLKAVLAEPDDTFRRLVYADALEERGEAERSEFIRVQCRLAALPDEIGRVRQHEHRAQSYAGGQMNQAYFCPLCNKETDLLQEEHDLRRRERELLGKDFCRWGVRIPGFTSVYRRGFVESVTCTAADWLRHADAILQAHPVREVRLTSFTSELFHRKWIRGDYGDVIFCVPPGVVFGDSPPSNSPVPDGD